MPCMKKLRVFRSGVPGSVARGDCRKRDATQWSFPSGFPSSRVMQPAHFGMPNPLPVLHPRCSVFRSEPPNRAELTGVNHLQ